MCYDDEGHDDGCRREESYLKTKTTYLCMNCGNELAKWQGQCPVCKEWNTIEEYSAPKGQKGFDTSTVSRRRPQTLKQIVSNEELRFDTGMKELDRVLGGGAVRGSLVLFSGAPGIGKSTLLLQICQTICRDQKVFYLSGEESEHQIKLRAARLGVTTDNLYVLSETNLTSALESADDLSPDLLIVDSVQTMYRSENDSAPGSVSQVKDCAMTLLQLCKQTGKTVFLVGHVNKEGSIAGPKVLEHMVDAVLYFEGERESSYRILRAEKNRFGSTNEIGVFEMEDKGLKEVPNPSEMLLAGRPKGTPGTCVACVMEGTRPILAEVQALVASTSFNVPRRTAVGVDYNRMNLLLAVMEKRAGMNLSAFDAYVNVIGGLELSEPAADLPIVLAVASSGRDQPVAEDLAAVGEVGLTGELRGVSNIQLRLQELARLGFHKCIIPRQGTEDVTALEGLQIMRARNIREAVEASLI